MDKVIVIRYGELYLKGKNRNYFERQLIKNIKEKMKMFNCVLKFGHSRYTIEEYDSNDESTIIKTLQTIFGLHSISIAKRLPSDYPTLLSSAIEITQNQGSFRVSANRADKKYFLTSVELAAKLGGDLLIAKPNLRVNLHSPDWTLFVDIREDGTAYMYSKTIMAAGGMPIGTAGKGLLMLSGGIDSPVAGYMMSKRGMQFDALHFHSYPYTSEKAKEKVIKLAQLMENYCGKIRLICVPITTIQEEIHKNCEDNYMITILRRFMMKIAERIAINRNCGCIINGESLGQVASQTLESITVTNSMVKSLPVFRPLIGMNKQEIIDIAEKIDTYETSILPYEDCCTIFLPENPVTRPNIERAEKEEAKLLNYDKLIEDAIANIEILDI